MKSLERQMPRDKVFSWLPGSGGGNKRDCEGALGPSACDGNVVMGGCDGCKPL